MNATTITGAPTYPWSHRAFRLIWKLVWLLAASWTPPQANLWRVWLLRLFGARISWQAKIYSSVQIWYPPNLEMAAYSCLGPRVNCYSMDRIAIGARSVVSQGVHLCGGSHDIEDHGFRLVTRPIVIGSDVWIAAEAFVGPGSHVNDGAVLGARTVLCGTAESHSVYVGNPAKKVRERKIYRGT
ncbi:putative colanic acid biosynthesis acetyltransferase [Ramlibacter henchirensis]|uniref:Putative colanic acid biosynthesis acetyltransferase n=1 Tax=Ramlibacter henchirensis TaxID=204072 RepID=A0A4Z0BUW1_9BURK|nr:putative colanic acid biosynthesis acetyltransferase [Ramlibacter henchirensis]